MLTASRLLQPSQKLLTVSDQPLVIVPDRLAAPREIIINTEIGEEMPVPERVARLIVQHRQAGQRSSAHLLPQRAKTELSDDRELMKDWDSFRTWIKYKRGYYKHLRTPEIMLLGSAVGDDLRKLHSTYQFLHAEMGDFRVLNDEIEINQSVNLKKRTDGFLRRGGSRSIAVCPAKLQGVSDRVVVKFTSPFTLRGGGQLEEVKRSAIMSAWEVGPRFYGLVIYPHSIGIVMSDVSDGVDALYRIEDHWFRTARNKPYAIALRERVNERTWESIKRVRRFVNLMVAHLVDVEPVLLPDGSLVLIDNEQVRFFDSEPGYKMDHMVFSWLFSGAIDDVGMITDDELRRIGRFLDKPTYRDTEGRRPYLRDIGFPY